MNPLASWYTCSGCGPSLRCRVCGAIECSQGMTPETCAARPVRHVRRYWTYPERHTKRLERAGTWQAPARQYTKPDRRRGHLKHGEWMWSDAVQSASTT